MFRSFLILLACGVSLVSAPLLTMGGVLDAGQGLKSSLEDAITVDFNDGYPSMGGATYWGGVLTTGSVYNVTSSPRWNQSQYLHVGPQWGTPASVTFAAPVDYFGFHGGTLDPYNYVDFYNGSTLIMRMTGTDVATMHTDAYINYFATTPDEYVTRIVFTSDTPAFETDNHAYRFATPPDLVVSKTPEPASMALIGAGLLAVWLGLRMRTSARK